MSGGDNFHFDMTGVPLGLALQVAFGTFQHAVAWDVQAIEPQTERGPIHVWGSNQATQRLVLHWHFVVGVGHPLPGKVDVEGTELFVRAWLADADYGPEPDHDGSNGKGWRVYNEAWRRVGDDPYAFVAIEPVWELYGK